MTWESAPGAVSRHLELPRHFRGRLSPSNGLRKGRSAVWGGRSAEILLRPCWVVLGTNPRRRPYIKGELSVFTVRETSDGFFVEKAGALRASVEPLKRA